MSKAFTRESDEAPETRSLPPLRALLPPGAKNYLTPGGARRLQQELADLQRQRAAANPAGLDAKILRLRQSVESAVVVEAPPPPWEQVRFGATVTVRNSDGEETRYRIVGVDETDLDRNWVSWLSPVAKALLNALLEERVRFKFPAGETQLHITAIAYE